MNAHEIFAGFVVPAGQDRAGERVRLGGEPSDCKVSAEDTDGRLCAFEFTGASGGPTHAHREQDEWLYVLAGEIDCLVGKQRHRISAGGSAFIPRTTRHAWASADGHPATVLDVYQPAGTIESFFRDVGKHVHPPIHEALGVGGLHRLFDAHGMKLLGPPLGWDGDGTR